MASSLEYGITRQGSSFRDTQCHERPRQHSDTPLCRLSSLHELVELLRTNDGVYMYKAAFRRNMLYKIRRYSELQRLAEEDVQRELELIRIKTEELKRIANVQGEGDNWLIFESLSEHYREAKGRAASFQVLRGRAETRLTGSMSVQELTINDTAFFLRDDLVQALQRLTDFAPSQPHIVGKVVDLVSSFLKDPALFHTTLMNFMLLGGAGTGKTTVASAIGDVFARAGIFVGDKLVKAGRAELVGQYEGQTVARTRNFLVSNLDNGVILIDEAYAITPWQNGKPEGYGSEAANALVEFMTRYPGLYCIIVAGYETQMVRYFLPTNEGLSRRFPNKFVLRGMTARELVDVFQRSLLHSQGYDTVPAGECVGAAVHESVHYFTKEAWEYLRRLIHLCTRGTVRYSDEYDAATQTTYHHVYSFKPNFEFMYRIFEHQAGSMTNLADEAVSILMGTVSYRQALQALKRDPDLRRPPFTAQPQSVMRRVVIQTIVKSSLSQSDRFLAQLEEVEALL